MRKIKGGVTAPLGFQAVGSHCGIKKRKKDLAILYSEVPSHTAAMFTTNRVQAAPLEVTREHLEDGSAQAVIINSGNANACTGKKGLKDAQMMARLTARELGIDEKDVLVASTGIIGRSLPIAKVKAGIGNLVGGLSRGGGHQAAEAIMTTDTFAKETAVVMEIGGKKVTIGGMAKGSGMIFPHLATLLVFITTDALIGKCALEHALKNSMDKSFNIISVDGDMSTNDMVVILANGRAGNREIRKKETNEFAEALEEVTSSLARMIVEDGEGATKFIEVKVRNAATQEEGRKVARAIANSNLVKTALHGEDPNWGRIMAALGGAGVEVNQDRIDIAIGDEKVVRNGSALSSDWPKVRRYLRRKKIRITVDLKMGRSETKVWTCDLSQEYVRINARYST